MSIQIISFDWLHHLSLTNKHRSSKLCDLENSCTWCFSEVPRYLFFVHKREDKQVKTLWFGYDHAALVPYIVTSSTEVFDSPTIISYSNSCNILETVLSFLATRKLVWKTIKGYTIILRDLLSKIIHLTIMCQGMSRIAEQEVSVQPGLPAQRHPMHMIVASV